MNVEYIEALIAAARTIAAAHGATVKISISTDKVEEPILLLVKPDGGGTWIGTERDGYRPVR